MLLRFTVKEDKNISFSPSLLNAMVTDDLATQGARVSAAMVLT